MKARRHQLSVFLPPEAIRLEADPTRLEQILVNLLTNAAKYTPEGGRVSLSAERDGDEAVIRCVDNGIGMSPDALESVFEPFVQIDPSLDRASSGLGIGLSSVKHLTQMHGGTIAAKSAGPGQGSEFTLRLPAIQADAAEAATVSEQRADEEPPRSSLRILVVDDNRDLAEGLSIFLQDAGHQVTLAHDGGTALAIATEQCPSAVLLDLGMPGIDGYVVAERMRANPDLQGTIIVAISGFPPNSERAKKARFDAHLVKPINHHDLFRLLHREVSLREAPSSQKESKRILLVEDNRDLALLTAELLRAQGQHVEVVFNGAEALEKVAQFRPEVVLCDLNLPDFSGIEVARRLREEVSLRPLLVGVTAHDTSDYEKDVDESAFDLFLTKPLDWSKVREALAAFEHRSLSGRSRVKGPD